MKHRLVQLLINRVPEIRTRFLERRPKERWKALAYLLWLQIRYYLPFRRGLGDEEIRLYSRASESSLSFRENPEKLAQSLLCYDAVSFDVFDTLLFRPFSKPTDLFYLVGMELEYPDFRRIRIETEEALRRKKWRETGSSEISFAEIWAAMEKKTGIPREKGMTAEWKWEQRCCFANPYMLRVVRELQAHGKPVLAVSDMYLSGTAVRSLLEGCGCSGLEACLVSSDAGVSKSGGGLYQKVLDLIGPSRTVLHIGDHPQADYEKARENHIPSLLYPNIHQTGGRYRTTDMSAITGSVYRGLIDIRLHSGLALYSQEYEYGFVYGGLFVVGYCRFIHTYADTHHLDKLLFLSRDGAVLLRAYRLMYPRESGRAVYAHWSRLAALKITARFFKEDYFRRFLDHKTNQGFSLRQILNSMELSDFMPPLCRKLGISADEELTNKNVENVKSYVHGRWDEVLAHYAPQEKAGGIYYRGLLGDSRRAAAVDIGWAGSGAVMLDAAVNRLWDLACPVTGILAGTLSGLSPDADGIEPFFLNGQLVSYLYSSRENRDLWKRHDPVRGHNLYWELLLGAPEGTLLGFYPDGCGGCRCRFKDPPVHTEAITAIHEGILDFVGLFLETERRIGMTIPVSGRDAYAPMLSVVGRKNRPFREKLEVLLDDIHIG